MGRRLDLFDLFVALSIIGIPLFSVVFCINIINLLKIVIHYPEQSVKKHTVLISISTAYILFSFVCILVAIGDAILLN